MGYARLPAVRASGKDAAMNASAQGRGDQLLTADRGFASASLTGRLLGRLPAPLFHRLIDRLDAAFDVGAMEGELPDGTIRLIGGRASGPVAHIRIRRWAALVRLMLSGSVGWFAAWMAGDWDSDDPVAVFAAFGANRRTLAGSGAKASAGLGRARGPMRLVNHLRHMARRNSRSGSRRNIHAHYDLGNDFYSAWLDGSMTYSSALFDPAHPDEPLEIAQLRKIDGALDRLDLSPGARLLEIGCGWGSLGLRAVDRFGVDYTGLTLSEAQAQRGRALIGDGAIAVEDYRDHRGLYDAIASLEMVEAVGQDYWPEYLDALNRLLVPGGKAAIQYIAIDDAIFPAYATNADFIQTYIFPGGCLLSESRFRALAEERGFAWVDQTDFSADYAETLRRWRVNYDRALAEARLPASFSAQFHRLWRYYLMYCEGGFRGGGITVAQVTLEKAR
jgi:cyclopropane-fatty-acyl-phospholipid synthase